MSQIIGLGIQLLLKVCVARVVHRHINKSSDLNDSLYGWTVISKLKVAPKVKLFHWKMVHGIIPLFTFLHGPNSGHPFPCLFYGLNVETTKYIIWKCSKVASCWNIMENFAVFSLRRIRKLSEGNWLLRILSVELGVGC